MDYWMQRKQSQSTLSSSLSFPMVGYRLEHFRRSNIKCLFKDTPALKPFTSEDKKLRSIPFSHCSGAAKETHARPRSTQIENRQMDVNTFTYMRTGL